MDLEVLDQIESEVFEEEEGNSGNKEERLEKEIVREKKEGKRKAKFNSGGEYFL